MKWNDVTLVGLTDDFSTFCPGYYGLKRRYNIPDARCFFPPHANCLANLTLDSKLIIMGHGIPQKMEDRTPGELVQYLVQTLGLRTVGVISFKTCLIGDGKFLEDFVMRANRYGLKVGWLVGYKTEVHWSVSKKTIVYTMEESLFYSREEKAEAKVVKGNIEVYPVELSERFLNYKDNPSSCNIM